MRSIVIRRNCKIRDRALVPGDGKGQIRTTHEFQPWAHKAGCRREGQTTDCGTHGPALPVLRCQDETCTVRRIAEAGASEQQIMTVLGHRSPKMALYYCAQASKRELSDEAMKLWERAA